MRNKRGLSARQSKFINTLIEGRLTTGEIEQAMRLRSSTLQRWMNEPAFKLQWKYANELLELRRKSDEETLRIRAAADARPAALPTQDARPPAPQAPTPPAPAPSPSARPQSAARAQRTDQAQPPLSERERLIARFGESAGTSFDRLLRLRREHEAGLGEDLNSNNGEMDHAGHHHRDDSSGAPGDWPRHGERLSPAGAVSLSLEKPGHLGGGVGGPL